MNRENIKHEPSLPWCYYDTRLKRLVLRLAAPAETLTASVVYGDPYNSRDGKWEHQEAAMEPQYAGAGKTIWRLAFEPPRWNRLMYGFRLKTAKEECYFSPKGIAPYTSDTVNSYFNHFFYPYIHAVDAPQTPEWVQNTVWYQIFPERFFNGNQSISPEKLADWSRDEPAYNNFFGGDLEGIRRKLPYLKDLGINGVYLTPIFESPSSHKYDTEDYFAIDRHFGTTADLKRLVSEAHALDIRIMLDAVFNHAGFTHPFWQDVLQNQERSEYKDYFHINHFPVKDYYMDRQRMDFEAFSFSPRMPKWNTENPRVRRYLIDAALHWIRECDIDAWRLDVANEVSFDFWKDFSKEVHALKSDFYVLGEVWYDASRWVNPGYFSAAMNYPLGFAVSEFFIEKKLSAEQFTENLFEALTCYSDLHTRAAFNLLDSHDTARILTRAQDDKLVLRNAFTMLFLLPGSPCVYYGTEVGMNGGNDPQCRRPMIWDTAQQDGELQAFFKQLITLRKTYSAIINNAAIQDAGALGDAHKWLIQDAGGSALSVFYTGDAALDYANLGSLVFSAIPAVDGKITPHTVAVFWFDGSQDRRG
jgi:glycosidase